MRPVGGHTMGGGEHGRTEAHTLLRLEAKRTQHHWRVMGVGDGQGTGEQYVEKASPPRVRGPL